MHLTPCISDWPPDVKSQPKDGEYEEEVEDSEHEGDGVHLAL